MLEIIVHGHPAPQGSKKFMGVRGGRGILVESSKAVKPWREAIRWTARQELGSHPVFSGPVSVRMVFTVPKPQAAPKLRRTWPVARPDLSKLARAVEDALVDAGVLRDDSLIVEYERLAKVYPQEDGESLESPGVRIKLRHAGEIYVEEE